MEVVSSGMEENLTFSEIKKAPPVQQSPVSREHDFIRKNRNLDAFILSKMSEKEKGAPTSSSTTKQAHAEKRKSSTTKGGETQQSSTKKRNIQTTLSMKHFVKLLKHTLVKTQDKDINDEKGFRGFLQSDGEDLRSIIEQIELEESAAKRSWDNVNDNSRTGMYENHEMSTSSSGAEKSMSREEKLMVILEVAIVSCEKNGWILLFSREHLKYFLATHKRYVSVVDFRHVNQNVNSRNTKDMNDRSDSNKKTGRSKRNHSPNLLSAMNRGSSSSVLARRIATKNVRGSILLEYAHSPRTFHQNFSRCDDDDIEALRFIVEHDLSIPSSIYYHMLASVDEDNQSDCGFRVPEYKADPKSIIVSGYQKISTGDNDHALIYLSGHCVLMLHENRLILPDINICREFSAETLHLLHQNGIDYVLIEVILPKAQIIDLLWVKMRETTTFGHTDDELRQRMAKISELNYSERLACAAQLLPGIAVVDCFENTDFSGSYIRKHTGSIKHPTYIHHRPNHILAAIGLQKNNVCLAYAYDDDNNKNKDELGKDNLPKLIYTSAVSNHGDLAGVFGVVPLQTKLEPRFTLEVVTSVPTATSTTLTTTTITTTPSTSIEINNTNDDRVTNYTVPTIELNGKEFQILNIKPSDLFLPTTNGTNPFCVADSDKIVLFKRAVLVEYRDSFGDSKELEKIVSAPVSAKITHFSEYQQCNTKPEDENKSSLLKISTEDMTDMMKDPKVRRHFVKLFSAIPESASFLKSLKENIEKINLPTNLQLDY